MGSTTAPPTTTPHPQKARVQCQKDRWERSNRFSQMLLETQVLSEPATVDRWRKM